MSATLYYFDGRGKAETIRLTMAATGIKFDQVDITEKDQFHKMISDGRLLFKQLPMVEFEGKNMVQSGSTTRFFARRGHLLDETEDEIYNIDCLYEGTRDLMSLFMRYGFDDYKVALDKAKNLGMARHMPIFEKELEKNGSNGYLVGNKLTLADIGLLEVLLTIDELLGAQEFDPYPNIQKFFTTIKSIPNIAAYLSSPQRRRMNDDKYIAEVNRVIK